MSLEVEFLGWMAPISASVHPASSSLLALLTDIPTGSCLHVSVTHGIPEVTVNLIFPGFTGESLF